MANNGVKMSDFTQLSQVANGDKIIMLHNGNAQADYSVVANAIIDKMKRENVVTTQTNNNNKIPSAGLVYGMNETIEDLQESTSTEQEEKSVIAEIVTVDDADGGEADLTLNLEPHQSGSGDPSPDNVRPISGWNAVKVTRTGKNVFPSKGLTQTLNGITIHSNDDGSFTVNGTATANAQFDLTLNNELKLQLGQYTVDLLADKAVTFDRQHVWWFFYNMGTQSDIVNCQFLSKTFTLNAVTATKFYLRITSGATVDNVTFYPMLVYGSDAPTEFEPYIAQTYPISFGSAGTVYGGSLDVTTGVLTVDRAMLINLASLTGWFVTGDNFILDLTSRGGATAIPSESSVVCSKYKTMPSKSSASAYNSDDCLVYEYLGQKWVVFRDSQYSTLNEFKASLGDDTQLVIKLATPQTYQLTPLEVRTLLGQNVIWMDAEGTIKLDYKTNAVATKGDVNDALARIKALAKITEAIAPVESSYTATQNYAIGDYLIVDYKLYKVTAAITSGATITEGTNVTATTIMAEIQALA